jgi:radical SAM superfamily enzyme YgiQ (UPF0313 family)
LCAYGLYAPLNADLLRSLGVDAIFGGEFEEAWRRLPNKSRNRRGRRVRQGTLPRIRFLVPDRSGLPPLGKYATLQMPDGARRLVGYTEATRGCKHLCRHCPIVPVYEGQFRSSSRTWCWRISTRKLRPARSTSPSAIPIF